MPETPLNPRWEHLGRPLKYDAAMLHRVNIRIPEDIMQKVVASAGDRNKSVVIRELLAVALERYENNGL